jgi:hypothetical protein
MKGFAALMLLMVVAVQPRAVACSCAKIRQESNLGVVQEALNDSAAVFVAKARRVDQHSREPLPGLLNSPDPGHVSLIEDVQFVVLEVFKGDVLVGQPVMVRNEYAPGSCARTVRNDPVWVIEVVSPEVTMPATVSDTWLIFADEREPWVLHQCSRSWPVNFPEAQDDLRFLRELQKKVPWVPPDFNPRATATPEVP